GETVESTRTSCAVVVGRSCHAALRAAAVRTFVIGETPATTRVFEQYFGGRNHTIVRAEAVLLARRADDAGADTCTVVIVDCSGQLAERALNFPQFQQLVDACALRAWPLVMLSDSRVFPVVKNQRYRESDATEPGSATGVYLQQCEQYLAAHCECHIILRTGPLLAAEGSNLLTMLLRRMRQGGTIEAVTEPRFCPTVLADLMRVTAAICDQIGCAAQCWGIYHDHSADTATAYELAETVLAAAGQYWQLGD